MVTVKVECPTCSLPIQLAGRPKVGQTVVCPSCEMPSRVSSVAPLALIWMDMDELFPIREITKGRDGRRRGRKGRGSAGKNQRRRTWSGDWEEDGRPRRNGRRPRQYDEDWV